MKTITIQVEYDNKVKKNNIIYSFDQVKHYGKDGLYTAFDGQYCSVLKLAGVIFFIQTTCDGKLINSKKYHSAVPRYVYKKSIIKLNDKKINVDK
jgi:hypothetical protein